MIRGATNFYIGPLCGLTGLCCEVMTRRLVACGGNVMSTEWIRLVGVHW